MEARLPRSIVPLPCLQVVSADISIVDPECDIAVATMAQLLLQQGKVTEALKYFERAAELSRTEGEIVNALSYAEATRTQLEVQEKYPQLAGRLVCTFSRAESFLPELCSESKTPWISHQR